jgi:hypothetical protein
MYAPSWVQKEIKFKNEQTLGSKDVFVQKIQEWLTLRGIKIKVDRQFGPVTRKAVELFQEKNHLAITGDVDRDTYDYLVEPLKTAIQVFENIIPYSFRGLLINYAKQHLNQHPMEVGGQNRGPWVRVYMKGNEGDQWAWCAGCVSFLIKQALYSFNYGNLVPYYYSVDHLTLWAKKRGRFLNGESVRIDPSILIPGDLFVLKHSIIKNDWIHTGLVTQVFNDSFKTIEGNTNDEGSREGYEMCERIRGFKRMDFISLDI